MRKVFNLSVFLLFWCAVFLITLSYAQNGNLGNGEIQENIQESDWIPWIMLENDEGKQGITESVEIQDDEDLEDPVLQVSQDAIVLNVAPNTSATLLSWRDFNLIVKNISDERGSIYNFSIKQMIYTWIIPLWVTTTWISTSDSERPVYAWFTWWIIYYTSEAETIYMNPDSSYMFYNMWWLTWLDLKKFNTSKVLDMSYMFSMENVGGTKLTDLDLSSFDTSNVTNMSHMFYKFGSLESIEFGNWNISNLIDMSSMFSNCTKLTNLDVWNWNTSSVENMNSLFSYCTNLDDIDISDWDTSNVINMGYMFDECSSLQWVDISSWNMDKVTGMQGMFRGTAISWYMDFSDKNLSNVVGMSSMFERVVGPLSVNFSGLNLNNLKSVNYMFEESNIENVNFRGATFNVGSGLDSYYMFNKAKVGSVDFWDVNFGKMNMQYMFVNAELHNVNFKGSDFSRVTRMSDMFHGCSWLQNLDFSNFDFSNVVSLSWMFENANIGKVDFSDSIFGNPDVSSVFRYADINIVDFSGANLSWLNKSMSNVFYDFSGEFVNFSNAKMGKVPSINYMFGRANIGKVSFNNADLTSVSDMGYMFNDATGMDFVDFSGVNLSKVTNMYNSFNGAFIEKVNFENVIFGNTRMEDAFNFSNVKEVSFNGADLSGVTSMRSMFFMSRRLEKVDFGETSVNSVTNLNSMFDDCPSLKELDLSSWDTSNVTDMGYMFWGCTGLKELDLSNFDTRKVTNMGSMFYNTPNLKTIYASDKFVTTALTWNYSSWLNMFYNSVNLVWWNGTKFDSWYTDKTYALIDKVWQTWYFTDKNAINVKFINTLDLTETLATFKKWQKLIPPYVDKYHAVWWYLDEEMKQAIDLNKWVDSYSVIYVKYERNGSSGWWGGWGWGWWATKPDTPKEEQKPAESPQSDVSTWTTVKEPESSTGNKAEIQTWSQVDSPEEIPQNDDSVSSWANAKDPENTTPMDSSILSQNDEKTYSTEFQQAYKFAHENGITTKDTIQSAQMNGKLTRIAMAKMLSQYAINVLWKEPDVSKWVVKFNDVTSKKDADYDNGVTLAYQLGIMWQNMPNNNFRPNDEVTRAEFATALSRMAYGTSDWEYKATSKYYIHHMEKLVKEWIITKDDPNMKELRGYVMIMLMRSAK